MRRSGEEPNWPRPDAKHIHMTPHSVHMPPLTYASSSAAYRGRHPFSYSRLVLLVPDDCDYYCTVVANVA